MIAPYLQEIASLAQIFNALGVMGILIFLVGAFYRGDIVSKPVLDRILERFWSEMATKFENLENKIDNAKAIQDAQKTTPRGW